MRYRTFLAALAFLPIVIAAKPTFASETSRPGGSSKCISESDVLTESHLPPQSARRRFIGRDASIFMQVVEPGIDTTFFDTAVVFLETNVAMVFKRGCAVGGRPKFLSVLDYIDATEMVTLFRNDAALRKLAHFDPAKVKSLAEAGDPAAQFHIGFRYRREHERQASIDWLTRSAKHNFDPAMVAVGAALSGPDWLGELQAHRVGQPFSSDKFTNRALAYYWLNRATDSTDQVIRHLAESNISGPLGLMARISPADLRKGRRLILEHESAPQDVIDKAVTLGSQKPVVFATPDQRSLEQIRKESEKQPGPVDIQLTTPEQVEAVRAMLDRLRRANAEFEKRMLELEKNGRLFRIPSGTVAHVAKPGPDQSQVEILSGQLKSKILYVENRDIIR